MILFIKFFGGLESLVPGATVFQKFSPHQLFLQESLFMCKKFFRTGVVAVILASLFSALVVSPAVADGITWRSQTTPVDGVNENAYQSVAYGNGVFVAVGDGPVTTRRLLTSSDGISWSSSAANFDWQTVTYGDGVFVILNDPTGGNRVLRSINNGATFSAANLGLFGDWQSVTYGTANGVGTFVAVSSTSAGGTNQQVMKSTNKGVAWTLHESRNNAWRSVTYGNGVFVAVSSSGTGDQVMTSTDGEFWATRTTPTFGSPLAGNSWQSVTYGTVNGVGTFVAVGASGAVMTSIDNGTTWISQTAAANNNWQSVTYGDGLFVAVSDNTLGDINNRVMTSTNGTTWVARAASANNAWQSVTYGNGVFVAVSSDGNRDRVMTSPAPPAFTLTSASESRTVNTAATGFTTNSTGGAIASFAINATPSGMSFNTTTGALTGTPNTVAAATTYTVTATNASGSTTRTFTLTVTAVLAPAFTLSASSESRTVNTLATGFTANSTGGAIASFAISATPPGMSFNTTTGALTGTPSTVAPATTYTVTATNASGNATQTFTLTVTAAPVVADNSSAQSEAARKAKEQRELTEILSIIPELGRLSRDIGKTSEALIGQRCVKKKEVRFVKKGAKCPKGFVKRK
jgi:hypothetical protein